MSPPSVCCLLCYSANWPHFHLIAYEFQALATVTEFKRTETLSKCIPNIIQSEKKVDKVALLFKSS